MAEPVLVVHGVANRDRNQFADEVRELGKLAGSEWRLIPVFWGDLGAKTDDLFDVIPQMPSRAVRGAAGEPDPALIAGVLGANVGSDAVRSDEAQRDSIVRGASETLSHDTAGTVRGVDRSEAIRDAVRETLPTTRYLQHVQDPAVLEAIGRALGAAAQTADVSGSQAAGGEATVRSGPYGGSPYADSGPYGMGGSTDTRGMLDGVKNASKSLLTEIDNIVGRTVGSALGQANQNLRRALGVQLVNFFGDVFVYQRESAKIQQRIWDAIAAEAPGYGTDQQPINVVAHSLGGVVTFDTAVRGQPPLSIKGLVTFGSQPAFFHVIDPRLPELARYAKTSPVKLPPRIQRWTNLWEFMDVLAFGASTIFQLASGDAPRDIPVDNPAHVLFENKGGTHSTYWKSEELAQALRDTLIK